MAKFKSDKGPMLEVRRDSIPCNTISPRPDPEWRFTDKAGHVHTGTWELLTRVQDDPEDPPFYFDADGEEHNAPSHLECRLCGETIIPDMTDPSPFNEYAYGPWRYYADGEEITKEEFARLTLGIPDIEG